MHGGWDLGLGTPQNVQQFLISTSHFTISRLQRLSSSRFRHSNTSNFRKINLLSIWETPPFNIGCQGWDCWQRCRHVCDREPSVFIFIHRHNFHAISSFFVDKEMKFPESPWSSLRYQSNLELAFRLNVWPFILSSRSHICF